jgi:hypothetical protein
MITVFMVRFKSSAARTCDPEWVVSLGEYKNVCNALNAGAIFLP